VSTDVDYAMVNCDLLPSRSCKSRYPAQAARVRETISFASQHGGASLLDFLHAQQDRNSTELNYLNLVGSYPTAAGQLNLAMGRGVIQ